jgi:hypothetical protein
MYMHPHASASMLVVLPAIINLIPDAQESIGFWKEKD